MEIVEGLEWNRIDSFGFVIESDLREIASNSVEIPLLNNLISEGKIAGSSWGESGWLVVGLGIEGSSEVRASTDIVQL